MGVKGRLNTPPGPRSPSILQQRPTIGVGTNTNPSPSNATVGVGSDRPTVGYRTPLIRPTTRVLLPLPVNPEVVEEAVLPMVAVAEEVAAAVEEVEVEEAAEMVEAEVGEEAEEAVEEATMMALVPHLIRLPLRLQSEPGTADAAVIGP